VLAGISGNTRSDACLEIGKSQATYIILQYAITGVEYSNSVSGSCFVSLLPEIEQKMAFCPMLDHYRRW
jgi:hypothetical protein